MSPRARQPLSIEQSLLGFLRERPMHGYEIYQRLSSPEGLGQVWRLKQSRLYALLAKLEREGYLAARLELQETRPSRKVFQLTAKGEEAFLEWLQSPVEHGRQFRLEFLAKLYFARREGEIIVSRLVERQQETCRAWQAKQQAQAEDVRQARPYDWLVHQFRIGQIEAMLNWLEVCRQMFQQGVGSKE